MKYFIRLLVVFGALFWSLPGQGQDIHFSQFYHSPMNMNPALTGVFKEDIRFIGNYRRQWQSVPVPYLTFSGAFDLKYFHQRFSNGFFAGGILLNHDQSGDAEMKFTQITLSGSYTHQLNENNLLTLGFQFGTGQRSFSIDRLSFGNQFNGDIYVPTSNSREDFRNVNTFYMDMSTGLNWHLQEEDQRYWLNVGVGVFHLTRPDVSFFDGAESRLQRRLTTYAMGGFQANDRIDVLLHAYGQQQGPSREIVAGTAFRYHLNQRRGKALAVQVGSAYRFIGTRDALIPSIEIHYNAWLLGFSYDLNLSEFRAATDRNGGPELAIIYTITKVKPLQEHKVCPIF